MKKIILLLFVALVGVTEAQSQEYHKEFTVAVSDEENWTPYPGGREVVYTPSKPDIVSISNDGKTATIKGLKVGEVVITAKFNGIERQALVKIVQRGTTSTTPQRPEDKPTQKTDGKKYITYNKPVKAYFIEYNGGANSVNRNSNAGNEGTVIEAYENMKYSHVWWTNSGEVFRCDLTMADGEEYRSDEAYRSGKWTWDKGYGKDGWDEEGYMEYEYPLDAFAAYISKRKGELGFLVFKQFVHYMK